MPRTLTPNVRSLAAADSPVLPFLAPRAIAEPSSRRPAARRHVSTSIATSRPTALLQAPSINAARPLKRPTDSLPRPLDLRYAEIYAFAQQRLAHHSSAPPLRRPWRESETQESRRVDSKSRVDPASMTANHVETYRLLVERRRKRQLARERRQYEMFKSYQQPGRTSLSQGRYRSLRRRLYALGQSKPAELDLTTETGHVRPAVTIYAFAALDRKVYAHRKRTSHLIRIRHHHQAIALSHDLCQGIHGFDPELMFMNWMKIPEADRNGLWHLVLVYLLDKRPGDALQFVSVLCGEHSASDLRPEVLADALEHLARIAAESLSQRVHPEWMSKLIPIFVSVYRTHLARYPAICTQDLLWNLSRIATHDDLKRLFDLLVKTKHYLTYATLLHYANAFSLFGDHTYALLCLKKLRELAGRTSTEAAKQVLNRQRTKWSCALILRRSMKHRENYHLTTKIVDIFVRLGVEVDILVYNVIMRNAMEARDYDTAFRVYNLVGENGMQPDKYTHSILLYGCCTAQDPSMFKEFAVFCADRAEEMMDPRLATDYLYWLYVQHKNDDPERLYHLLHSAYSRFFNQGPLEPFCASSITETQASTMEPSLVALYLMLQAIIRKALAAPDGVQQVWTHYKTFDLHVRKGTYPLLTELAKNPVIWNAFLLAFCRQQQFANASSLIKNMTDGSDSRSPSYSARTNIPPPNVYSWNIFMQAFFKNEQSRAAERILEIMRSRGVEPDQFTYEVLLSGYAKTQQVPQIAEVMGHIEDEQQLDPKVLQALARVHDRKRLLMTLEKSRVAKEEDERKKAQQEEEKLEERWKRPQFSSLLGSKKLKL